MDTEKCAALLCVLDCGSISAAADRLGYTVSGVSRMMAALEAETGFPLLVRSKTGVVPTEDCRMLLPTIRELKRLGALYVSRSAAVCGLGPGGPSKGGRGVLSPPGLRDGTLHRHLSRAGD